MIWKKQPVGSKLADLQNNKASKDAATQSAAGLMSASDKTKLDGVATGATAVSVVNDLNSDSTTSALSAAQGKALNSNINKESLNALTRLRESDNMNSVRAGTYYQQAGSQYMPVNAPSSAYNAIIEVLEGYNGTFRWQIWRSINANLTYYRQSGDSGSTWTAWDSFALNSKMFVNTPATPPNNTINNHTLFGSWFGKDDAITGLPTSSGTYYYSVLLCGNVQFAVRYSSTGMVGCFIRYYINDQFYAWREVAAEGKYTEKKTVYLSNGASTTFSVSAYGAARIYAIGFSDDSISEIIVRNNNGTLVRKNISGGTYVGISLSNGVITITNNYQYEIPFEIQAIQSATLY